MGIDSTCLFPIPWSLSQTLSLERNYLPVPTSTRPSDIPTPSSTIPIPGSTPEPSETLVVEIKEEKEVEEVEELVVIREEKLSNKLSVRIDKTNCLHNNGKSGEIKI